MAQPSTRRVGCGAISLGNTVVSVRRSHLEEVNIVVGLLVYVRPSHLEGINIVIDLFLLLVGSPRCLSGGHDAPTLWWVTNC